MSLYAAMTLMCAAVVALTGTNAQARLAKKRLFNDEDRDVVAAARLWTPVRWLQRPSSRRALATAEARVRDDPERWERYVDLCTELRAWNALETSVALALPASVVGLIAAIA
jgi:hypothetical protein